MLFSFLSGRRMWQKELLWFGLFFFFFPFFFGRRESYYGCYRQDQQELLLRN